MGNKTKLKLLPALFKNRDWPSCKNPKTVSFRASPDMFKTVNSVYLDETPPDSPWFTNGSSSRTFSSTEYHRSEEFDCELLEIVVRGVVTASSDRLFFEPRGETKSMVEEIKNPNDRIVRFKERSVTMIAMESENPYWDFRKSMEEMMETNCGLMKDWDCLEELLSWYLKVNGKNNHGFIIGAFVDLLVNISNTSSSNEEEDVSDDTMSSFLSCTSSLSLMEDCGQIIETKDLLVRS